MDAPPAAPSDGAAPAAPAPVCGRDGCDFGCWRVATDSTGVSIFNDYCGRTCATADDENARAGFGGTECSSRPRCLLPNCQRASAQFASGMRFGFCTFSHMHEHLAALMVAVEDAQESSFAPLSTPPASSPPSPPGDAPPLALWHAAISELPAETVARFMPQAFGNTQNDGDNSATLGDSAIGHFVVLHLSNGGLTDKGEITNRKAEAVKNETFMRLFERVFPRIGGPHDFSLHFSPQGQAGPSSASIFEPLAGCGAANASILAGSPPNMYAKARSLQKAAGDAIESFAGVLVKANNFDAVNDLAAFLVAETRSDGVVDPLGTLLGAPHGGSCTVPQQTGENEFVATAMSKDGLHSFTATGRSKKAARAAAARAILEKLGAIAVAPVCARAPDVIKPRSYSQNWELRHHEDQLLMGLQPMPATSIAKAVMDKLTTKKNAYRMALASPIRHKHLVVHAAALNRAGSNPLDGDTIVTMITVQWIDGGYATFTAHGTSNSMANSAAGLQYAVATLSRHGSEDLMISDEQRTQYAQTASATLATALSDRDAMCDAQRVKFALQCAARPPATAECVQILSEIHYKDPRVAAYPPAAWLAAADRAGVMRMIRVLLATDAFYLVEMVFTVFGVATCLPAARKFMDEEAARLDTTVLRAMDLGKTGELGGQLRMDWRFDLTREVLPFANLSFRLAVASAIEQAPMYVAHALKLTTTPPQGATSLSVARPAPGGVAAILCGLGQYANYESVLGYLYNTEAYERDGDGEHLALGCDLNVFAFARLSGPGYVNSLADALRAETPESVLNSDNRVNRTSLLWEQLRKYDDRDSVCGSALAFHIAATTTIPPERVVALHGSLAAFSAARAAANRRQFRLRLAGFHRMALRLNEAKQRLEVADGQAIGYSGDDGDVAMGDGGPPPDAPPSPPSHGGRRRRRLGWLFAPVWALINATPGTCLLSAARIRPEAIALGRSPACSAKDGPVLDQFAAAPPPLCSSLLAEPAYVSPVADQLYGCAAPLLSACTAVAFTSDDLGLLQLPCMVPPPRAGYVAPPGAAPSPAADAMRQFGALPAASSLIAARCRAPRPASAHAARAAYQTSRLRSLYADTSPWAICPGNPERLSALMRETSDTASVRKRSAASNEDTALKWWCDGCDFADTTWQRMDPAADPHHVEHGLWLMRETAILEMVTLYVARNMNGRTAGKGSALIASVVSTLSKARTVLKECGVRIPENVCIKALLRGLVIKHVAAHGQVPVKQTQPWARHHLEAMFGVAHGALCNGKPVDLASPSWCARRLGLSLSVCCGFRKVAMTGAPGEPNLMMDAVSYFHDGVEVEYSEAVAATFSRGRTLIRIRPPAGDKTDYTGRTYGSRYIWLHWDPAEPTNPAVYLMARERLFPCQGAARRLQPVLTPDGLASYTGAQLDAQLRPWQLMVMTPKEADETSWHSGRVTLASALGAKGHAHSRIMELCRWASESSVATYKRLQPTEYADAVHSSLLGNAASFPEALRAVVDDEALIRRVEAELRRAGSTDSPSAASPHVSTASEVEYAVEAISARRTTASGVQQFLVKWVGYPDTTWEPVSNLAECAALDTFLADEVACPPTVQRDDRAARRHGTLPRRAHTPRGHALDPPRGPSSAHVSHHWERTAKRARTLSPREARVRAAAHAHARHTARVAEPNSAHVSHRVGNSPPSALTHAHFVRLESAPRHTRVHRTQLASRALTS